MSITYIPSSCFLAHHKQLKSHLSFNVLLSSLCISELSESCIYSGAVNLKKNPLYSNITLLLSQMSTFSVTIQRPQFRVQPVITALPEKGVLESGVEKVCLKKISHANKGMQSFIQCFTLKFRQLIQLMKFSAVQLGFNSQADRGNPEELLLISSMGL